MTAEGAAFGTGAYETYDEARAVSLYCDYTGEFHKRRGHTYLCEIVPRSTVLAMSDRPDYAAEVTIGDWDDDREPDEATRATFLSVTAPRSRKMRRILPFSPIWSVEEDLRGYKIAGRNHDAKYVRVSAEVSFGPAGLSRCEDDERRVVYTGENIRGLVHFQIGLNFARYIHTISDKTVDIVPFEPIDWRLRLYCPCGKRYQMTREQALVTYRNALDNGIRGVPVRLCATSF